MTNKRETGIAPARDTPGYYLDRPQRFGILPTRAFWTRADIPPRVHQFLIRAGGPFIFAGIAVGAISLPISAGAASILAGVSAPMLMTLYYGVLERYIRHRLEKRQPLLGVGGELPESRDQ